MPSDWSEIRKDFPALDRYVYLNAAGGSPTPRPVGEAVAKHYREVERGGTLFWDAWLARREIIRVKAAELLGAEADEIAFVANASEGMNVLADLLGSEGPVLTDEIEFPTVTLPWVHRGIAVHFLPVVEGVVRIESFGMANAPKASTILISHVQFSNGCRQDLEAFGETKEARRLVVCGSQSAGAFPIDVRRARVDAFTTSGHKWLCAGYGAGLLYVSRHLLAARPPRSIGWLSVENPFEFENRSYALLPTNRRAELGCPSFAGIFALGAALDYVLGIGIPAIAERILELNLYLTERLARAGFTVLSPGGPHRSGETLVEVEEPRVAERFLRDRAVLVTRKAQGVRISTHFYNNESDVDACVEALEDFRKTR